MRLFQYEWEDETVSIVAAENKEEAIELLNEFGDPDIECIAPLRNLMLTLCPSIKQGNLAWAIDNIGYNTVLELPMLEDLPDDEPDISTKSNVIDLCNFVKES